MKIILNDSHLEIWSEMNQSCFAYLERAPKTKLFQHAWWRWGLRNQKGRRQGHRGKKEEEEDHSQPLECLFIM